VKVWLQLCFSMLVCWCGALTTSALEVVLRQDQPAADSLVEWELRGVDAAWLTSDVSRTPTLYITSPNNRIWERRAFLYQPCQPSKADAAAIPMGELVLCFRHTPRVDGAHKWVIKAPDGSELSAGVLQVTKKTGSYPLGMLKVSTDNPRLLSFMDGTIFIPIGPNLCWANAPNQLGKFNSWFETLGKEKCNHVRLWCASWCGQIEGEQPDSYRQDQAWLFDQILALARQHGLKVTVAIDNHHDMGLGKFFPYGKTYEERLKSFLSVPIGAQYQRRLQYMLARWGADDTIAAWELMNELDLAQPQREAALRWAAAAAKTISGLDIDNRLITVSWSGDDWDLVAKIDQIDVAQVHSYVVEWTDKIGLRSKITRDGIDMLLNSADRGNSLGKPFCFSEVGYQGTNEENPGNVADKQGLLLRQQAWAGFLLGGYGSGMNWWWDVYVEPRKLWKNYGSMARVVAKLDWRDAELLPLTPNSGASLRVIGWQSSTQALLWPQVRADTWHAHIVEGHGRSQLTVEQSVRIRGMKPQTRFQVHYIDMLSGDERSHREAKSDGSGVLNLAVLPPNVDVVVWIEQAQ
jgi:Cellulase (glycosyl hydrolase family 5)